MAAQTEKSSKHIAVLAFPFGCHPLSLFNLVQKLAIASPDTNFSFLTTSQSNNSIFLSPNIPSNIKSFNVEDGAPDHHVFSGNPIEKVELFLTSSPGNFNKGLDLAVAEIGQRVSCLITDAFLTFSGSIADGLGIPWIPVWIPSPHSLSAHIYTDTIREFFANDLRSDQTLEAIPGLSMMQISDLSIEVLPRNAQETKFSRMLIRIREMLPKATALVMNFYQELYPASLLEDLKSKCEILLNVGFVTLYMPPRTLSSIDDTGCLPWLDSQKVQSSVAYISFGTVVNIPRSEIEELAEALEEKEIPFVWSLRNNLIENLPNGFLERTNRHGKVVSWAPQDQVLAHDSIGVFVTHCGANSVYESIANGVPMICRPFFGDNRMNGRVVEDVWKIGVRVDGGVFTKKGVVKSLEIILEHEQGKEIRRRVNDLKELVIKAAAPNENAAKDINNLVELINSSVTFDRHFSNHK